MITFDNINDLIRNFNLDRTHWINIESFRFTKNKVYKKTEVNITHVPEEYLDKKVKCKNNHSFSLDWLKKRPPVSCFYSKEKGLLRQYSLIINCPICSIPVWVELPQTKYKGELEIFGDEAKRKVDGKTIFVYSFVSFSGSKNQKEKFEQEFLKIKKDLSPEYNPKQWVFHMKELTSSDRRDKKKHLKNIQREDAQESIIKIAKLIGKYNRKKELNIYNATGIVQDDKLKFREEQFIQSSIYNAALTRVIGETTSSNLAPKFYFERTGNDGWAKNLFDGGRLTLLWPFITNNIPVKTPEFVEPEMSLYLEIADIVSYMVARYLFCLGKRAEGIEIRTDYDLSFLEDIRYILTVENGDWINTISKDFPNKLMFKGTSWEKHL